MHFAGVEQVIKTIKTKALGKVGAHISEALIPQCEQHGNLTREYIKCFVRGDIGFVSRKHPLQIRQRSLTLYHPVSTCRMSKSIDKGVVDQRLR